MTRVVRFHEYGEPEVLRIDDIEVPAPAPDEVQIEVKAIGLNRAEVMFRKNAYLQQAEFPSRLGYEAAGTVKAFGGHVSGFAEGMRSASSPHSIWRGGAHMGRSSTFRPGTLSGIRKICPSNRLPHRGCNM